MKTFLLSIWSMAMFSIYMGFPTLGWCVILNVGVVYTTLFFIVAYKLFKKMSNEWTIQDSERTSLLLWLCSWSFVTFIFILHDVKIVLDVGIISALWLFFILLTTIMTSCYVIIRDSGKWTTEIFSVSVTHWVLFHNSMDWLTQTPFILTIPIICIILIRGSYHLENMYQSTFPKPILTCCELLIWVVFLAIELSFDSKLLKHDTFYFLITFGMVIMLLLYTKPMFAFIISTSLFFIPAFCLWTLYNIKIYGLVFGLNKSWKTFENWWNKEPKIADIADPALNINNFSDDML